MFCSNGPSVDSAIVSNYDAALDFLDGEFERGFGKQEGGAHDRRDHIGIRYHDTDVISLYPNGDTSFRTGGWDTISTQNWLQSNAFHTVSLYIPRGYGQPGKYSTIRSNAAENRLRKEYGLPSMTEQRYLSKWNFQEWVPIKGEPGERGHYGEYEIVDQDGYERFLAFEEEMTRTDRCPTYLFHEGITFSRRGACHSISAEKLSKVLALERRETERRMAFTRNAQSCSYKAIRRLRRGMPMVGTCACGDTGLGMLDFRNIRRHVANRSICGYQIRTAVQIFLGKNGMDSRNWSAWLNFHFTANDNPALGGPGMSPKGEPIIRRAVYKHLAQAQP